MTDDSDGAGDRGGHGAGARLEAGDSPEAEAHAPGDRREIAYVTVHDGAETDLLVAPVGATLRDVLLAHGHSPYTRLTRRANCGGRGLCATCGVRVAGDVPAEHWHDRLADRFGYPRLSCQLTVEGDLAVAIPDKRVWGGRERDPAVGEER